MKPCFVVYNSSNHLLCLCNSNRQGLVGQLFFAHMVTLGPFSWSLRILFLDGTLGMRCWYWGFPCCQLGNPVPLWTSPRDSLDFFRTGWEDSKNVPRSRGSSEHPRTPESHCYSIAWPRKFVAFFNPSSSPY